MRRLLVVAVALFAWGTARADEPPADLPPVDNGVHDYDATEGASHGGHARPDPATFVLEHVSDAEIFEIDLPWGGEFKFDVAKPFSFLVFERTPGACSAPISSSMRNFPSLERFLGGCWDFRPTKAVMMIWIASLILLLVIQLAKRRDALGVPRGILTNCVEVLYVFIRDDVAGSSMRQSDARKYTPFLASLFFFILFVNWLGLVPGMFSGTGVLAVTGGLAIITFFLTQAAGIRTAGIGGYLKHLTGGVPAFLWILMIPVEIVGLFTKPLALLVRLYANMLGGHVSLFFTLALIFMIHPGVALLSVPMVGTIYVLEIFVGILQAYIFTLLTAMYIALALDMGHHDKDEEAALRAPPHGEELVSFAATHSGTEVRA